MALFGKKEKKEEKIVADKTVANKTVIKKTVKKFKTATLKKNSSQKSPQKSPKKISLKSGAVSKRDLSWVLKGPRITEKGAVIAELNNVYTFDISSRANKIDVKQAISTIYKVEPVKIAIARVPSKKVQVRGQRGKLGTKSGGKKAYIYLKKGDKIEFV